MARNEAGEGNRTLAFITKRIPFENLLNNRLYSDVTPIFGSTDSSETILRHRMPRCAIFSFTRGLSLDPWQPARGGIERPAAIGAGGSPRLRHGLRGTTVDPLNANMLASGIEAPG